MRAEQSLALPATLEQRRAQRPLGMPEVMPEVPVEVVPSEGDRPGLVAEVLAGALRVPEPE